MPARAHPDRRRLPAAIAVAVVAFLLVASCDGGDPGGAESPAPATTAAPPPLAAQPSASDGGTAEVAEIGFSVLAERDSGRVNLAWAATFENTSRTDLLTYVDFELTWSSAGGETEVVWSSETDDISLQRAHDVLPGSAAVVGGTRSVGFVPDSLEVSVDHDEWYPMADLQAHGVPVGVEVTGYRIDAGPAARVQVDFTSSYENQVGGEELRLLVALRDADGTLIGAAVAGSDFAASPAGARDRDGTVEPSQWPDAADVDNSEATIVKACCAWVGVG